MTIIFYITVVLLFLISIVLSSVILLQEGKSAGLGASFGGDAGESVFGTGAADVLKQFTAWLAVAFFIGCVMLSLWTSHLGRTTGAIDIPQYQIEEAE